MEVIMETNQQEPNQIPPTKEAPKSFFQRNIVGVIVFCLFIFYDLLRSGNPASLVIDIPLGLLIAAIIQLLFNGLRKAFTK